MVSYRHMKNLLCFFILVLCIGCPQSDKNRLFRTTRTVGKSGVIVYGYKQKVGSIENTNAYAVTIKKVYVSGHGIYPGPVIKISAGGKVVDSDRYSGRWPAGYYIYTEGKAVPADYIEPDVDMFNRAEYAERRARGVW